MLFEQKARKKRRKIKPPDPAKAKKKTRSGVAVSGLQYSMVRKVKRIIGWKTIDGVSTPHIWNVWGQDLKDFNMDLVFPERKTKLK